MSVSNLLVPVSKSKALSGRFTWPDKPVLASVRSADVGPLRRLSQELKKRLGAKPRIARDAVSSAELRIRRDGSIKGGEAYRLTIGADGIEIVSSGDAGAYYAIQTLTDLVRIEGRKLRACRIDDEPDFARRGVYLDCSRGKVPTVETIKQLIERLAHWKINEFQLYIENVFTFSLHPAIGRGYSPFTPSDILEIQDFCKLHHVRFVGSLTSFGHFEKILMLKQYRSLGEMPGHKGHAGGTTLCPGDPGSIRLLADMYEEFVPLFEAEDFNCCCDETWELGRGRSKRRADKTGVGRVYLGFLKKIRKLCQAHGKRMNAWADIILNHPDLLPDVPKDIVMLNWGYSTNSRRIPQTPDLARAGLPFMVCPGVGTWQSHGARLANSMGNIRNFAAEGRKCGAEGVLNTDWGDCLHRNSLGASMHGFAYGAAHSWQGRRVDEASFTKRFCRQYLGQTTNDLARALVALGKSHLACGASAESNSSWLYHALVEPGGTSVDARPPSEKADPAGMRKVIARLSDQSIWPDAAPGSEPFEKLVIQESALAAWMDVIAARRSLVLRSLRRGQDVPAARLRELADDYRRMAGQFRKLWLARNRPSRLVENMRLFDRARKHLLAAARRG